MLSFVKWTEVGGLEQPASSIRFGTRYQFCEKKIFPLDWGKGDGFGMILQAHCIYYVLLFSIITSDSLLIIRRRSQRLGTLAEGDLGINPGRREN